MSRKKSTIDDFFSTRLKGLIEETLKVSQAFFANKVGISQSYLSAILNKKRGVSAELIIGLYIHYSEYLDWLLTGEGEMARQGTEYDTCIYKVKDFEHRVAEKKIEYDPKISELLKMTRIVLESGTEFSDSLAANIRSFFHSVQMEKRLSDVESQLSVVKEKIKKCPAGSEGSGVKKKM